MKKYMIFFTSLAVAACSQAEIQEAEIEDVQLARLEIDVRTASETKSLVEGTTLPSGSEIGLFVADEIRRRQPGSETQEANATYDGVPLNNIKYTAAGEGPSQKWSTDTDIMLSVAEGYVFAYYPYDETWDLNGGLPIEASSDVQIDYMISGIMDAPIVNIKNNYATLKMQHALSCVRINVKRMELNKVFEIQSVAIKSSAIATNAKLGIGSINNFTNITGIGETLVRDETFTLTDEYKTIDFIVIPSGMAGELFIRFEVDGFDYYGATTLLELEPGKIYEYNYGIYNEMDVKLENVNVKTWEVVTNDGIINLM